MYSIRRVKESDYSNNHLELYSQLSKINPRLITQRQYSEYLLRCVVHNITIFVVVDSETNKIIGTATLLIEEKLLHNFGKVGHIEDVVVDKEHRGKNIGKVLIEHLANYAKENGCYKIILNCSLEKQQFYEKCGLVNSNIQMSKYFND
jgi:glucosamine-phosphate N-acetyltransferase